MFLKTTNLTTNIMESGIVARTEFYNYLVENDLLGYNNRIPMSVIHEILNISMPDNMCWREADKLKLFRLKMTDFVVVKLLSQGKYMAKEGDCFRILTGSENYAKVKGYRLEARRKYKRADQLLRSTPEIFKKDVDSTSNILAQLEYQHTHEADGLAKLMA